MNHEFDRSARATRPNAGNINIYIEVLHFKTGRADPQNSSTRAKSPGNRQRYARPRKTTDQNSGAMNSATCMGADINALTQFINLKTTTIDGERAQERTIPKC